MIKKLTLKVAKTKEEFEEMEKNLIEDGFVFVSIKLEYGIYGFYKYERQETDEQYVIDYRLNNLH